MAERQQQEWAELDARINAILPPQYQYRYESVRPGSMGSAGLRYGDDGKVAWGEMWSSFCDLALAGGPPHRGTLLGPTPVEQAGTDKEGYAAVIAEISRGIRLAAGLQTVKHAPDGWLAVQCRGQGMAAWLVRAVMAENVWARRKGDLLLVPAGSHFRVEKEIKNVITSMAKACHHWTDHTGSKVREAIGRTLCEPEVGLIEPTLPWEALADPSTYEEAFRAAEAAVRHSLGVEPVEGTYTGWIGAPCGDEGMAVWMMRSMIALNVLARREKDVLFLPVRPSVGEETVQMAANLATVSRLWAWHTATRGEE